MSDFREAMSELEGLSSHGQAFLIIDQICEEMDKPLYKSKSEATRKVLE